MKSRKKSSKGGKGRDTGAASRKARSDADTAVTTVSQKIQDRAANYNSSSREIYMRAMRGRSRKDAMTAFCTMCMGYNPNEVKECTDPACPLYPYRLKR